MTVEHFPIVKEDWLEKGQKYEYDVISYAFDAISDVLNGIR